MSPRTASSKLLRELLCFVAKGWKWSLSTWKGPQTSYVCVLQRTGSAYKVYQSINTDKTKPWLTRDWMFQDVFWAVCKSCWQFCNWRELYAKIIKCFKGTVFGYLLFFMILNTGDAKHASQVYTFFRKQKHCQCCPPGCDLNVLLWFHSFHPEASNVFATTNIWIRGI